MKLAVAIPPDVTTEIRTTPAPDAGVVTVIDGGATAGTAKEGAAARAGESLRALQGLLADPLGGLGIPQQPQHKDLQHDTERA